MTNFIPHETKIFNDREPPWINNKVKTMIQEKNKIYQLYLKNKSNMLATKPETRQNLYMKPWIAVKVNTIKASQKIML